MMAAIPDAYRKDVSALPPLLRALLDAELAAGNEIADVHHAFPAPPIGACVMLARPVTTRPRESGDGISFRAFNSSLYSGEFTDETRHFFITESPLPPPAEPDMDAIRTAHTLGVRSSAANGPDRVRSSTSGGTSGGTVERFRASMAIDYEKWHDGIGFDLDVLNNASDRDKATIVTLLTPPTGWRDVEALAALNNEAANAALRHAMQHGSVEVQAAVTSYAPWVATDDERTTLLVHALTHGEFYGGLTSVLGQVADFHPKPVVDALFRGLFVRPGEIACHFAAMLTYVHGKADSTFDWDTRPLFLRFNSDDGAERLRAFHVLCSLLERDPAHVLESIGHPASS